MSQHPITLGFAVVIIGVILIALGSLSQARDSKFHWGIGGFIGPVPFGFGSSKEMVYLAVAISVVMVIVYLYTFLR